MEIRRSDWEEYKELLAEQVRAMALNKYNNLLTSGRWSTKDTKDNQILALVKMDQKLAGESKKAS